MSIYEKQQHLSQCHDKCRELHGKLSSYERGCGDVKDRHEGNNSGIPTCFPQGAAEKKTVPIFSGCLAYFPDAIAFIARCSYIGNEQHNPGTPLHWDRAKSGDEKDACLRHMMLSGTLDDDGIPHSVKAAWRALANAQKEIEQKGWKL